MTHPQQSSVEELKECREELLPLPEPDFYPLAGPPSYSFLSMRAYALANMNRRPSPSPAEVEGELTDGEIRQIGAKIFGIDLRVDGWLVEFARAIERALNQRLAVSDDQQAKDAAYNDCTPHIHVSDSAFEDWYQSHPKASGGDKQLARDAYAAGMGDPIIASSSVRYQYMRENVGGHMEGHDFILYDDRLDEAIDAATSTTKQEEV